MKSIPEAFIPAALALLMALLAGSCATSARKTGVLDDESRAYASGLFEQSKADRADGNLEAAELAVRELVNNYPAFARMDEATYMAGEIAFEMGKFDDAASYFEAVTDGYPLSPLRSAAAFSAARSYAELGNHSKSAEILIELIDSPVDAGLRDAASEELRALVRIHLDPAEMESLARKYPSSPINREIAVALARHNYANGEYDAAYELLAEFLYRFPEESDATEARRLLKLSAEKRQAPVERPPGVVEPNTVGAILPVTGPGQMSLFARDFNQGCRRAVDEFNRSGGRHVKLATADTKGSGVGAVKAVRKLVLEDGALALVGSVFTMPTITAAIEANAWGVPLLSPVVSAEDLLEIGPWVFETKVPQEVEVAAMADVAVTRLLLERIAIVAPTEGRGKESADLFADEVTRLGAEVVEDARYERGATDFRQELEAVRESAPDAIFITGDYQELLNVLPQVKFYDLQVQLLGLSNWNNENLLRLFKGELEGALFPLETYHGRDPAAYRRLKAVLEEEGKGEVNPVMVAGYFGMRLLLESIAAGASDRDEVRSYLHTALNQGAEKRLAEANALTILIVRSGKAREFTPPPRPSSGY
jgi:branched-chain amino acid transport system substrate-binding protein